jgi:hypothetical protein
MMNLRPLAAELVARGHEVYLAAGDLTRSIDVFGDLFDGSPPLPLRALRERAGVRGEVRLLAAPWKTRRNKTTDTIYTFADLLLNIGFGDGNALVAHLAAWRTMFDLVQPDVLVCDHSPTALLAAKTMTRSRRAVSSEPPAEPGAARQAGDFAVATVGTGFFTPPDESPLRLLRPASPEQTADARQRESKLLDIMNSVLPPLAPCCPELAVASGRGAGSGTRRGEGKGLLDRVTQLYHDGRTRHFLLTFPELDHFPDRAETQSTRGACSTLAPTGQPMSAQASGLGTQPISSTESPNGAEYDLYCGALPYGLGGEPFHRPPGHRCIFAYLKPFPTLEDFLRLLSASPIRAVAYIDGIPTSRLAKLQTDRLRFATGPVDIRQAAEACDAGITNANSATCTAMLLAGKPLVSVPLFLEQGMFAAAVQRLAAGLTAGTNDAKAILAALNQVLDDPRFTTAARAFAARHKSDNLANIPRRIVDELEHLVAENTSST